MLRRENLRKYQNKASRFVVKRRYAALFIDMGLGKTIITLTAIVDLIKSGQIENVLLVAPIRVIKGVWRQEAKEWAHTRGLKFSLVYGNQTQRMKALQTPAHIYLINPEGLPWLSGTVLRGKRWPWDMLVVDESTMFATPTTARFKSIRKGLKYFKRRVILTGTPTPRSLLQLWSQMFMVDMGYSLGQRYTDYKKNFFHKSGYKGYVMLPNDGAEDEITEAVSQRVVRLESDDWIELPKLVNNYVWIDLPPGVRDLYNRFEQDMFLEWENEDVEALNAAALSGKCRQIANGAIYTRDLETGDQSWRAIHDEKINAMREIVDSLQGAPVLTAYQFKHDLERLKANFPKFTPFDKNKVEGIIEKWNQRKLHGLIAHPKNAGHGLNLQRGGRHIIWFGPTFSLELLQQFVKRLHRSGQTGTVMNYMILARNTVDEVVVEALERYGTQAERINAAFKHYYERHSR